MGVGGEEDAGGSHGHESVVRETAIAAPLLIYIYFKGKYISKRYSHSNQL